MDGKEVGGKWAQQAPEHRHIVSELAAFLFLILAAVFLIAAAGIILRVGYTLEATLFIVATLLLIVFAAWLFLSRFRPRRP